MFQDILSNFDFLTPLSYPLLAVDYSPKLHFTELIEVAVSQTWRPKMQFPGSASHFKTNF